MYTDFFGLKEKPFNLTPSSRFLYLGESHREALALLTYGVNERKGFILLTGEVGTGKTTMVQALLENLDHNVEYVYLSNPLLSADDLMNYLAFSALKKKVHFKSKSEFLLEFEAFLKQCLQHQKNFVLIIDEAQKLSFELLEEIRLLSNMETADEKLINIFLVGQPELNKHLSEARCRPLLQRISVRHHITPLNLEETGEYVMTRMKIAGTGEGDKVFPKRTIKALHDYSSGYPRMINILADNALLLSYSREKRRVTPDMVKECYEDMKLDGSFLSSNKKETDQPESAEDETHKRSRPWKWVAVVVILLALAFGVTPTGRDVLKNYKRLLQVDIPADPKPAQEEVVEFPQKVNGKIVEQNERKVEESPLTEQEKTENQKVESPEIRDTGPAEAISPIETNITEPLRTITVERGDTLLGLVAKVYGFANENILNLLQQHNPELVDINRIEVGQRIVFPRIGSPSSAGSPVFTVHVASFKPFEHARALFEKFMNEGYEVYMMPVYNPEKGKIFRVTLGSFKSRRESDAYAAAMRRRGVTDYAESIQLEMR